MKLWKFLCVLVVVAPTDVHAKDPYYFHPENVDRETYVADYYECAELAGGVTGKSPYVYAPRDIVSQATHAFMSGFLQARDRRRGAEMVIRTCMADKGYTRRRIDKATDKALREMEEQERVDRLYDLASAENAKGEELVE